VIVAGVRQCIDANYYFSAVEIAAPVWTTEDTHFGIDLSVGRKVWVVSLEVVEVEVVGHMACSGALQAMKPGAVTVVVSGVAAEDLDLRLPVVELEMEAL
jgi:hypothetical protein